MSVYDGDQIAAQESHTHYVEVLQRKSHSVWGLTKAEADAEQVPASPDPLADFPSHSIIDFSVQPEKSWRKIAKRLKTLAIARGCQFKPA